MSTLRRVNLFIKNVLGVLGFDIEIGIFYSRKKTICICTIAILKNAIKSFN